MKLSRDINTCQKTAWFMLRRLHEAYMSDEPPAEFLNGGNYQIDEAFIGGLEGNKHSEDRIKGSQGGCDQDDRLVHNTQCIKEDLGASG